MRRPVQGVHEHVCTCCVHRSPLLGIETATLCRPCGETVVLLRSHSSVCLPLRCTPLHKRYCVPYVYHFVHCLFAEADTWLKVAIPCKDRISVPIHSGLERIIYFAFVSWISLSFENSADEVPLTYISTRLVNAESESKFLVLLP